MIKIKLMWIAFRGGNRAGRARLGRANSGPGQNRARPKLAQFFRANILIAQSALKTGPVGPNSLFNAKKNSGGPGQIWPDFFRANNLMARPGPNFGRAGLAHWVGPILPPLIAFHKAAPFLVSSWTVCCHCSISSIFSIQNQGFIFQSLFPKVML